MAKKQTTKSAPQGKRPRQAAKNPSQSRSSGAADFTKQKKQATAPKQKPQPKRVNRDAAAEAATPGNMLWRLALILCVGLVVFSLLFASINGGGKYVGVTTEKENATPTPPVSSVDPNVNITGSDATPIPPSPTPGVDPTPAPNGGENSGGMIINGQPVTQ